MGYFKGIMDDEKKRWVWDELWKIKNDLYETNYGRFGQQRKKNNGISKKLWMIKKKMGLRGIMKDKKIISIRRIMEDLVNKEKKNNGILKELWMMKKKMGLGRIMEDKKIISVRRIMEDLVNKKKMIVFQRNYG